MSQRVSSSAATRTGDRWRCSPASSNSLKAPRRHIQLPKCSTRLHWLKPRWVWVPETRPWSLTCRRCGPMLSPRVPNLVPIPGPRMERETPGQRPRPNYGHPQALERPRTALSTTPLQGPPPTADPHPQSPPRAAAPPGRMRTERRPGTADLPRGAPAVVPGEGQRIREHPRPGGRPTSGTDAAADLLTHRVAGTHVPRSQPTPHSQQDRRCPSARATTLRSLAPLASTPRRTMRAV